MSDKQRAVTNGLVSADKEYTFMWLAITVYFVVVSILNLNNCFSN
jgi:hypothetical protein